MKIRILLNCAMAVLLVLLTADFGGRPWLNVVATLEREATDWRLSRQADDGQKNSEIVIVDIDRDSLQAIGNWPWSRDHIAQIVNQLFDTYQVRAAAFTFPFPAPDTNGLSVFDQIQSEVQDQLLSGVGGFAARQRLQRLREKFDYDSSLSEALQKQQILLGYSFDNSARVEGRLPEPVEFFDDESGRIPDILIAESGEEWHYYRGYAGNLPDLLNSAAGAGFVNFTPDADGLIRRAPLLASHAKKSYESLALAMIRRADNPGQVLKMLLEDGDLELILAGKYEMPINESGEMYFNFLGVGGPTADYENSRNAVFRYISAHRIINGEAPAEIFRDKIVLIGSSAAALRDTYSTPLNPAMPGAELLATQIANIMDGKVLERSWKANALAFLALFGVALLTAAVSALIGPVFSAVLTVILCAASVYINLHFWHDQLQALNLVAPLLVLIGLFLWNAISGFLFEWRASRNLQSTFGQYVPPELAKRMGQRQTMSLEGESRQISVLFSDVRDFTSISETFTPQDLTKLMNRMLTALSTAIHEHGGTVDKFIGDAIMAFWNAPLDDPEHFTNSVLSAMAMQQAMNQLSDELVAEGHPPMRLGVGICSGEASVGNMGSQLRMAYTAMGDTVNVASRVEGLTKYYKIGILVTESTCQLCKDSGLAFREVDSVRVKGRARPLTIYEPIGNEHMLSSERRASLEKFVEMRALYVRGDFAAAQAALAEYRHMEPQDGLGEVYEERLAEFVQSPPAEWEGVTNFETK